MPKTTVTQYKTFIFTGSYDQFNHCCILLNKSINECVYVNEPRHLRGYIFGPNGGTLICFGQWFNKRERDDILETARSYQMSIVEINDVTSHYR